MARICFFARVKDHTVLERVEFYAQDLAILRELGYDVMVATKAAEIRRADLYFCWWWTWSFIPVLVAKLLRKPAVVTGVFDEWKFDGRAWLQRQLLTWTLRNARANIFVSKLETRKVPSRFQTTRPSFSPCVVDGVKYSPSDRSRARFVLTVAWLHAENAERKGIPEIIRAAALIRFHAPDVRFVIVGERGSGYLSLQQLASDLAVADIVEFRGLVSEQEKIHLLRTCGVYLQPSRFEGFGLAVLEAMSCAAPIVASSGGALPEVVGDTAVVLDEVSPFTIANAVCRLLDDPKAAHQLGLRARQRAQSSFSIGRRREDIRTVLDNVGPHDLNFTVQ